MQKKCFGCGSNFQTKSPNEPGYIKEELLKENDDSLICQRCFRLKHYNEDLDVSEIEFDYKALFKRIKEENGLVVYLMDFFDLDNSLLSEYHQLLSNLKTLVVVNKFDILSKTITEFKSNTYIRKCLRDNNLKFLDLIIASSYREDDMLEIIDKIDSFSNNKNIYFFGMSNVGKSSILNKIIKLASLDAKELTVSNLIKTTLQEVYIPYKNRFIVDTPGVVREDHFSAYLSKKTLEKITPKKAIKPKVFQLNPKQTLFINGFCQIDFTRGEPSSIITYFENNLLVHRTKLENASSLFSAQQDKLLSLPTKEERDGLGKIVKYKFRVNQEEKKDIVISGLGFFSVSGNANIEVSTFEKIKISIRDSII